MAGRGDLLKLFRQTDASSDQPDRAPDSHRRHRSVNPLWLVCIFWFHFFAAIRDKRLNSQHRFQFTGAPVSRRRGCVKSGAIQKLNQYPRGICACHRGLKTPRSPTVSSAVGMEYTVSRALQFFLATCVRQRALNACHAKLPGVSGLNVEDAHWESHSDRAHLRRNSQSRTTTLRLVHGTGLYRPEHGYYSSGRCAIGRKGDYLTNLASAVPRPCISNLVR